MEMKKCSCCIYMREREEEMRNESNWTIFSLLTLPIGTLRKNIQVAGCTKCDGKMVEYALRNG